MPKQSTTPADKRKPRKPLTRSQLAAVHSRNREAAEDLQDELDDEAINAGEAYRDESGEVHYFAEEEDDDFDLLDECPHGNNPEDCEDCEDEREYDGHLSNLHLTDFD